ncbi:MAG: hypothetical protein FH756_15950 [Firmicutes bacterium]|nr:hypothetical protein [Bacillota bacterium]
MSKNRIPITLEVLEHLRTHIINQETDFCNFDIEVARSFSGKTSVRFIDTDNGVIIEQYFLEDDIDEMTEDNVDLQILLRRRDLPF